MTKSDVRENVKRNIGYYLAANNMSQRELAQVLGVSTSAVTKWVKGQNAPDIETIAKICDFFNVSFLEILGNNGGEPITPHDKLLIRQYKKKKEMQHAVDALLGVSEYMDEDKE